MAGGERVGYHAAHVVADEVDLGGDVEAFEELEDVVCHGGLCVARGGFEDRPAPRYLGALIR